MRAVDKARYQEKREARIVQMATWRTENREASRAASRRWADANSAKVRENQAAWRDANRDHVARYGRTYYQLNSGKKREYSRQWSAANPERRRASHAAYRATDPASHNRRVRDWKHQNPKAAAAYDRKKKARRRGAPQIRYSYHELQARLSLFGNRCYLCGVDGEAVDHVKPLSAGGWDCLANIRPICTSCNSRKNSTWPFARVSPAFNFIN
ncbi:HNH endonuclease [Nocardia cyriacigeorgica]|uniref:HNH endonuclease n=1 Tax=Nocardia cyriacigeorgica TaxID=135487 RepID=A0A6P1CPU0_9NOCA|nr:HNH endonuclease signature motif containing protein [Nocardia cyriacigeorgica]NEW33842.1 HNH endonuclease [Nocardia cyriacigeorgica]